jgi:hypothetical protein
MTTANDAESVEEGGQLGQKVQKKGQYVHCRTPVARLALDSE